MVKLRLTRTGKKKQPTYRIIATDSRSPRDGRFLEVLGHYNPHTDPATVVTKEERIMDWLSKGAQPSDAVKRLLINQKIWEKFTGKPHKWPEPVKKAVKEEASQEQAAEAVEA